MGRYWSGNTRAPWHDYTQPKIYHITLMKAPGVPPFGYLAGDWRLPAGTYGRSYIKATSLGVVIKNCLREIRSIHPALRIYQYALMPDHLHLLLAVEEPLDEVLGRKLAALKVQINTQSNIPSVFAKGFNDQIMTPDRRLDTVYTYLRENPYRLAVRRACPGFFTRVNEIKIGDTTYSAYGNLHLLASPFKQQVVVHRADSAVKKQNDRNLWLYTAANSGVLVSPFISTAERAVRTDAEELGGKIIMIVHEAFGERYKPSAHDFDLCSEGSLLIVSLGYPKGTDLTRDLCLRMNALADTIARQ